MKSNSMNFSFKKVCLLFLIPTVIFSLFYFIISFHYQNNYVELLQSTFYNEIQIFTQQTEEKFENIIHEAKNLDAYPQFIEAMSSMGSIDSSNEVIPILKSFVASQRLVHSAVIINRNNQTVTTNEGSFSLNDYFKNFRKYSVDYWKNFSSLYDTVQTLPPQEWNFSDDNPSVISLIISPWKGEFNRTLFVVNISTKEILNSINHQILTQNTSFFLLDNYNMELFAPNKYDASLFSNVNDHITKDFSYKNVLEKDIKIDKDKYMLLFSEQTKASWYHTYIAAIPYDDIYNKFPPFSAYIIAIGVLLCLISLIFAYFEARLLYRPIAQLESIVEKNFIKQGINKNTLESIDNALNDLYAIQNDYNTALSILKEKHLTDILINENNSISSNNTKDIFLENKISFSNPYFVTIAFKFLFEKNVYDTLDSSNSTLLKDFSEVLKNLFSQSFDTYLIKEQKTNPILYIIINSSDNNFLDKVQNIVDEFENPFKTDKKLLTIYHGISEVYLGYENISFSFKEAKNLLKEAMNKAISKKQSNNDFVEFTLNDEQLLINYLISGHIDKAEQFTFSFIKHFNDESFEPDRNRICTIILSAIFSIMHRLQIPYKHSPDEGEADIIVKALRLSQKDLLNYFAELFSLINAQFSTYNSKLNIIHVIEYISQNYTSPNLSLDILAQKFSTNSSYLSRRIKQYLNMNFSDYLAKIRIDKAKELLSSTDMNITQIYESVGFYSRTTFLRVFQKLVGLTPTEYRNTNDNQ